MSQYDTYSNKWSAKTQSNKHFAHKYLEKPAIYKLVGDVTQKSVLCLGCGSGQECQELLDRGAKRVVGIDNSKGLINQAVYQYPEVKFVCQDLEKLDLKDSFELIFSSLTLHYLADWPQFFARIKNLLKPGGKFVFSTHHPIKWGSQTNRNKDYNQFLLGYKKYKRDNQKYQIYGDYLNFRPIDDTLFGELRIKFYHRSISQMFAEITKAGWLVKQIIEPEPLPSSQKIKSDFYEVYSKIPLFILFELEVCE